jgi:hypothetical protein
VKEGKKEKKKSTVQKNRRIFPPLEERKRKGKGKGFLCGRAREGTREMAKEEMLLWCACL